VRFFLVWIDAEDRRTEPDETLTGRKNNRLSDFHVMAVRQGVPREGNPARKERKRKEKGPRSFFFVVITLSCQGHLRSSSSDQAPSCWWVFL